MKEKDNKFEVGKCYTFSHIPTGRAFDVECIDRNGINVTFEGCDNDRYVLPILKKYTLYSDCEYVVYEDYICSAF